MITTEEILVAGLTSLGAVEHERTRKYRVFSFPNDAIKGRKFFVGHKGAIRVGMTQTTSRSFGNPAYRTRFYYSIFNAGVLLMKKLEKIDDSKN
jgi:hypothetical protein